MTTALAIIAIVVSAAAAYSSFRSQRAARRSAGAAERSAGAGERSAAAAEQSATAAERSVSAAERSATAAEEQLALNRPKPFDFQIKRTSSAEWILINRSTTKVTGVTIEEPATGIFRPPTVRPALEVGAYVAFVLMGAAETPLPGTLVVRCNESPEAHIVEVPV